MDNEFDSKEESEEKVPEPQVTSFDPEERKLARKLRIQKRVEAIRKQSENLGEESPEEVQKPLLEKQIEASADLLEQLLVEGEEVVTNVRVGNDAREVNRREKEALRRADLLEKLQAEAEDAEEKYQAISGKWEEISKYKDPLDINDSILEQKQKCDELSKQKDEIIAMLREEVNLAELKYTTDQEIQGDDITTLIRRIDNQVDLMRKAYRNELKLIEETIVTERRILVEANTKQWETLHKQRNEDEEKNMQKRLELADTFLDAFYKVRVQHEELFRETKILLESETQTLQKELEELKASCLLNGEKLDYNYQILKKREEENIIIRSQQKRLINKLQDEINRINKQIKNFKAKSNDNITKLTAEIKKMRNSVFEIESKAEHISQCNDQKYHAVWDLNEKTAAELLDKILTTDKIIHEHLLGLDWKFPKKPFCRKQYLSSYKDAVDILGKKGGNKPDLRGKGMDDASFPRNFVEAVLEKIAFRSGFLIEKKLTHILPELQRSESQLVKVDNVFNALGVKSPEEFNLLLEFFIPYARCPLCESTEKSITETKKSVSGTQSDHDSANEATEIIAPQLPDVMKAVTESPGVITDIVHKELEEFREELADDIKSQSNEVSSSKTSSESSSDVSHTTYSKTGTVAVTLLCKLNHPMVVDNAHVYKALKEFVSAFNHTSNKVPSITERLTRTRNTLSRLITEDDVNLFWNQYGTVFSKTQDEVWNSLLFGLKKYHAILIDRNNIYMELQGFRKENKELKHLLKQCTAESEKSKKRRRSTRVSPYSSRTSTATSTSASRDI